MASRGSVVWDSQLLGITAGCTLCWKEGGARAEVERKWSGSGECEELHAEGWPNLSWPACISLSNAQLLTHSFLCDTLNYLTKIKWQLSLRETLAPPLKMTVVWQQGKKGIFLLLELVFTLFQRISALDAPDNPSSSWLWIPFSGFL